MDLAKFQDECLEAHNSCRKAHGAHKLQHDPDVSREAQKWAEQLARNDILKHSKTTLGENVAFTSGTATGGLVTKMWYDEIKDYSWSKHGSANGRPVGHFTQVVWKGSTHAGFGIAKGKSGTYAVGNYKPAGNIANPGYFEKNVGQQGSKPDLPDDPKTSAKEMPTPGTSVETKTEIYEEGGRRMKKTTTITTTVTEDPKGTFTTSTSTKTKIEKLRDNEIASGMEGLSTSDNDNTDDDSSDDERENDMPRFDKKLFRKECLMGLKRLRQQDGLPRLRRSSVLQKAAQQHANRMLRSGNWSFIDGARHGQAVAQSKPRVSGEAVADHWYEKAKSYGKTGGVTAKDSRQAGIGIASNSDKMTFMIALFDSQGDGANLFVAGVFDE